MNHEGVVMHFRRLASAAALLVSSLHAQAGFEVLDTRFGTDSVIVDSGTSLQWLRLDQTYGQSYNDVYGQLGTTFSGFRFATGAEVMSLIGSLGIGNGNPNSGPVDPAPPQSVLDASHSFLALFGARGDGTTSLSLRGASFQGVPTFHNDGGTLVADPRVFQPISVFWSPTQTGYDDDTSGFFTPTAYSAIGAYLVAVAPIPEPSTYALLGGGLLLMILRSRRRSAA